MISKMKYALAIFCCLLTLGATAQTWDLVPIEELSPTDVFVIVDLSSGRAMSNSNGTGSAPSAVSITLSGDNTQLVGDVADNLKWNISGNGTDGYVFYPNGSTGSWLYCTSTNNGVRVGTNANKHFTWHNRWLYHTATSRYVGVYDNSNWRCYSDSTVNIGNTDTRFYRYTDNAAVAHPVFTPAGGTYYAPVSVSMSCETEGATIHYTTDGTEPTAASTAYNAPIEISTTTTLKAIAILGSDVSNVASATYNFPEIIDAENIAMLRSVEADATTLYRLTGTAIVTFANSSRHNKYIQDATGGILIDDPNGIISEPYIMGDAMTNLIGTLQNYNGMLQFVPAVSPGAPVSQGNAVAPTTLTLDELRENYETFEAQLITLANVIINPINGVDTFAYNKYYNLNGEENPKMGVKYNDLDLIGESIPVLAQDITGVLYDYNGVYEIFPRSISDLENAATECSTTPVLGNCSATIDERDMLFASQIASTDAQCTMLSYGFVYSVTNTEPEISSSECTVVEVGNSIEPGTDFSYRLAELGFNTYHVRAYATNEFGTGYSNTTDIQQVEPEEYTITFVVDGYEEAVATVHFLEGQEPLLLEPIDGCKGLEFAGWALTSFDGTSSTHPEFFSTFTPTSDTTFHAVFASRQNLENDYFIISRADFDTVAAYGTPDQWTAVSEINGTVISGWADLFTNANCMQMRNSSQPHPYNETAVPGRISDIIIFGAESISTPRPWTPYVSENPLNENNFTTEGVALEPQTLAASSVAAWYVDAIDDANYFYLSLAGGANYVDSILIGYLTGDILYTCIPVDTVVLDETLCEGMTYENDYFQTDVAGTHTFLAESENYCSTYYILNLEFATPDTIEHHIDTCDSYVLNGIEYTESTELLLENYDDFMNPCPVYEKWDIQIRQTSRTELENTTCGAYEWNGITYTESGIYEQIFHNAAGCDSVVTLNLTILHGNFAESIESVCLGEGETYDWHGEALSESGEYFHFETGENGCTDTSAVLLTVNHPDTIVFNATICQGEIYNENGFNESTEGQYAQYLTNATDCDSIVYLNLTVNPNYNTEIEDSACTSFTWLNEIYTESGIYERTLQSETGCDSTVTLHLTIFNGQYTLYEIAECGEEYLWEVSGETYSRSGLYEVYQENEHGCQDTLALQLTLNRPATSEIHAQICEGETYNANGFNENAAGDYTLHLQTMAGCDSTVTLHLTIGTETVNNIEATICEGNSYLENGFNITLPEAGVHTYSNVIERPGTCDSIVNLTLTVNQPVETEFSQTNCESFTWNNETYTESGDFTQTFTAENGCDSVVTLHLTINLPVETEFSQTDCESFTWNNETYTESGDFTQTFTAENGCDSVVTLHLTINQSVATSDSIVICGSDLPYTYNDTVFEIGTPQFSTYHFQFLTQNGCDSIVTLYLTVTTIDTEIEWYGTPEGTDRLEVVQENAEYQWINCDSNVLIPGETSSTFTPEVRGNYACVITYQGCVDTTDCVEVEPSGVAENGVPLMRIYPNPTKGVFTVSAPQPGNVEIEVFDIYGKLVRSQRMEGESVKIDLTAAAPGMYLVRMTQNGKALDSEKVLLTR